MKKILVIFLFITTFVTSNASQNGYKLIHMKLTTSNKNIKIDGEHLYKNDDFIKIFKNLSFLIDQNKDFSFISGDFYLNYHEIDSLLLSTGFLSNKLNENVLKKIQVIEKTVSVYMENKNDYNFVFKLGDIVDISKIRNTKYVNKKVLFKDIDRNFTAIWYQYDGLEVYGLFFREKALK